MFRFEKDMVDMVYSMYTAGNKKVILEVKNVFGVPDMVVMNENEIISIEFKLKYWQKALKQAFRYKNFSNKVYVYLDDDYIIPAKKNIDQFIKFDIGLCGVTKDEKVVTYYEPSLKSPFCKATTGSLMKEFEKSLTGA